LWDIPLPGWRQERQDFQITERRRSRKRWRRRGGEEWSAWWPWRCLPYGASKIHHLWQRQIDASRSEFMREFTYCLRHL
jgi:hypothetical protein